MEEIDEIGKYIQEQVRFVTEKSYLISNERILKNGKFFDIDIVLCPEITHGILNISLFVVYVNDEFYIKETLHEERFADKDSAISRRKHIIENIDLMLVNEFKGTQLEHYLSGDVFKTQEAEESFIEYEIDNDGNPKAVIKTRNILIEPKR